MKDEHLQGQARNRILTHPALTLLKEHFSASGKPPVYLVGGALRDAWLGRPVLDLDFALPGDAMGLARNLAGIINARYVPLDDDWGVARLVWKLPGQENTLPLNLDFSALQGEDIVEDLWQRDFTCNAMALRLNAPNPQWEDPTGGQVDLKAGQLRMVSPYAFRQDPLRLLRAFRLAASLELAIEPTTLKALETEKHGISSPAGERIHDELYKLLSCPGSYAYVVLMDQTGILTILFPELAGLKGLEQGKHHLGDGWHHTLETLRMLEQGLEQGFQELGPWQDHLREWLDRHQDLIPLLKLAALFHDIGKPPTYRLGPDNDIHFYGHATKGAEILIPVMQRIRASRRDQERVRTWVRHHMGPLHMLLALEKGRLAERAKIRFLKKLGPDVPGMLILALADMKATGKGATEERSDRYLSLLDSLLNLYVHRDAAARHTPPLLTGRDLIEALGLAPGPLIGRLLGLVDEARVQGQIKDRSQALDLARSLLRELQT